MSKPLTPDSPSYQEAALRVAVNDVLSHFKFWDVTPGALAALRPHVAALRVAHDDLTVAPHHLLLAVNSFVAAFDFTTSAHPALLPGQYLLGARSRLQQAFATPDLGLVASQEGSLRGTVADFLATWKTSEETSARNRADFPHLPPLPRGRVRAGITHFRETSRASSRLKTADKALHTAYSELTFAPAHLRLAVSHFLMTWALLSEYGGSPLARARKSLERAFDPATPPAQSVYHAPDAVAV